MTEKKQMPIQMIDEKQIRKIANLSRLEIQDADIPKLSSQLSSILSYIETLNELDLTGIKPTAHAVEVANVFREDVAVQSDVARDVLSRAPESDNVFFKVPKVL